MSSIKHPKPTLVPNVVATTTGPIFNTDCGCTSPRMHCMYQVSKWVIFHVEHLWNDPTQLSSSFCSPCHAMDTSPHPHRTIDHWRSSTSQSVDCTIASTSGLVYNEICLVPGPYPVFQCCTLKNGRRATLKKLGTWETRPRSDTRGRQNSLRGDIIHCRYSNKIGGTGKRP